MKEKRKNLVMSLVISAIISGILAGVIYVNTVRYPLELPSIEEIGDASILNRLYVPFWLVILFSLVCFAVLTLIFYLVISKIKKRKEKDNGWSEFLINHLVFSVFLFFNKFFVKI
jgi:Na+-translocating ferredoxin:NAD+ oxidoreductase RnfG subunit